MWILSDDEALAMYTHYHPSILAILMSALSDPLVVDRHTPVA